MEVPLSKNHHYIPQYWLRAFAIPGTGETWVRQKDDTVTQKKSIRRIMAIDWYSITFDGRFTASDQLESALSVPERNAKEAFARIYKSPQNTTAEDYATLIFTIALVACRHPDTRERHQPAVTIIGSGVIAARTAGSYEIAREAFNRETGSELSEDVYEDICALPEEDLIYTLALTEDRPSYHPELPAQILSLEAIPQISSELLAFHCTILTSSTPCFILSNRPIPTTGLGNAFSVPLSPTVALQFGPKGATGDVSWPPIHVIPAQGLEIAKINTEQEDRADIIIGSERKLVENLR